MKYSYPLLLLSTLLPPTTATPDAAAVPPTPPLLTRLETALTTWQDTFFSPTQLTWPRGIDWTNAFHGTLLASLLPRFPSHTSSLLLFFRGQDVAALRTQAYDDMLWVVLNWLEAHTSIHQTTPDSPHLPHFEARAREFYNLAANGWDTQLCGGGMTWSPHLEPYKNAITNQLWIAASIRMYQVLPTRNIAHLLAAADGYSWLNSTRMRNTHGLYADGYHITNVTSGGTVCDRLDRMVYTYNQGVLLTGLRGLYEELDDRRYLDDAFSLIDATVRADSELVRAGVLTEKCDPAGYCSQNGQTFKAIWMHHLAYFCGLPEARERCRGLYAGFVRRSAEAAWATRNATGVAGMWWGSPAGSVRAGEAQTVRDVENGCVEEEEDVCEMRQRRVGWRAGDANDRGRGRTVESHAGLVAALRAAVELGGEEA